MNLSIKETNGEILAISQFTLHARVKKGNRPSFINAADPKLGEKYYLEFIKRLKDQGFKVETGQFGGYMDLKLTNDGPTTIIIDSRQP